MHYLCYKVPEKVKGQYLQTEIRSLVWNSCHQDQTNNTEVVSVAIFYS